MSECSASYLLPPTSIPVRPVLGNEVAGVRARALDRPCHSRETHLPAPTVARPFAPFPTFPVPLPTSLGPTRGSCRLPSTSPPQNPITPSNFLFLSPLISALSLSLPQSLSPSLAWFYPHPIL